jgi:hypothetical protein
MPTGLKLNKTESIYKFVCYKTTARKMYNIKDRKCTYKVALRRVRTFAFCTLLRWSCHVIHWSYIFYCSQFLHILYYRTLLGYYYYGTALCFFKNVLLVTLTLFSFKCSVIHTLCDRLWSVWLRSVFHNCLVNGTTFERKVLEILRYMCVLIFSTNFEENISHSRKNSVRYYYKHT